MMTTSDYLHDIMYDLMTIRNMVLSHCDGDELAEECERYVSTYDNSILSLLQHEQDGKLINASALLWLERANNKFRDWAFAFKHGTDVEEELVKFMLDIAFQIDLQQDLDL